MSPPNSTTAATGRSPRPGTCRPPRCLASTSRCCAARHRRTKATSPSSCVMSPATPQVLFQTSDPTWQAYNTYGGSDFYQGAANGRAYKISYNRPFATRGGATERGLLLQQRVPDSCGSWRRTATTSATSAASTPTGFGSDAAQPQGLPLRRPRRILVGRATRQRRGGPRRRREPPVPLRQRGVLAHPLRAIRRPQRHPVPHARLLQGDVGQREDRPDRRMDRHLARPPVRLAGQRRRDCRRTASPAPCTCRTTATLPSPSPRRREDPPVAQHLRWPPWPPGSTRGPRPAHDRLRIRRRRRQRIPARRAHPAVHDDGRRRRVPARTSATSWSRARPPTT